MADIAEDSLLDIEDSTEVVKLNVLVHDKEESKVVKQRLTNAQYCIASLNH